MNRHSCLLCTSACEHPDPSTTSGRGYRGSPVPRPPSLSEQAASTCGRQKAMAGSTLRTIREQVARLLVTYDNDITRIRNSQSDVRIRNTVQYNSLPSRAE